MAQVQRSPYLFPPGARLGSDNVVLQASARRHRVDSYAGPLSIKTVLSGEVAWIVRGRELLLDPSSFLILAAGEPYSMNIDERRPVRTCCVFFAPGFVERVALDRTSTMDAALNDPERAVSSLPYLSATHRDRERALARHVQSLAPRCSLELAPSGFEEDFLSLADRLLELYVEVRNQEARIAAARESTRAELLRRLLLGREYMHAHVAETVSLAGAANAACLSPFHFHRGFVQAFQQTPHAYLTALRLQRARMLLECGAPVLEVCLAVGFASPSAFSRLFRRHYAESPSEVRRRFARSG